MSESYEKKRFGCKLPELKTSVPGLKSEELSKLSVRYEPQSITRISPDNPPVFWKKAKGANIMDVEDNIYIDCTSAFGVSFIGHNDSKVDEAILKQSKNLLHDMENIFPSEVRVSLSKRLLDVVDRSENSQVLYANSGSECVEIAIKASLLYTHKPGIIAFKGGFHGQTIGALNVTGQEDLRTPFLDYISKHTRFMPFPNPYREGTDDKEYPFSDVCVERIENEIQRSENTSSPIGTVILEPIQGCNGYIIPPDSFVKELYSLCKKYGMVMIADEIFAGMGRTGKWLAMDHVGITPDIVCVGKILGGGLPIAACIASKEIFEAFNSSSFLALHGSTFAGDPIVCSSAIAVINKIENENLLEEASRKGQLFKNKLMMLKQKYDLVGDIRGKGLILAIELVKNRTTKEPASSETSYIVEAALKKGVVIITTRIPFGNVIAMAPPVVITEEQMDYVVEVLDDCIHEIYNKNLEVS